MNIKIVIKDGNSNPAIVTNNTLSQVEYKKKNMLYQPPSNQKKVPEKKNQKNKKKQQKQKQTNQAQRKMMKQFDKLSKNQVSLDMVQNSNNILQRQNQILENNQHTINQLIKNTQNNKNTKLQVEHQAMNILKSATQKVTKQVEEIKKIRDQIVNVGKQVSKALGDMKAPQPGFKIPKQLTDMNQNIKNLTQVSQNHLEGLQNLEALKNLQNFNVQVYMQQVNTLKKQIIQYQKQSENIQKQLRLRAAKLQKLQLPKNIDNQILQPYMKHLQGKANSIDLHQIKDNVYAKIGTFDYSRLESEVNDLVNQIRSQVGDFYIVCKQHEIHVPSININLKEFKNLDVKFPSVLDQYKIANGINFKQRKQDYQSNSSPSKNGQRLKSTSKQAKKNNNNQRNKQKQRLKQLITQPIDLSHPVKLTSKDQQFKQTILGNDEKYKMEKKIKQSKKEMKSRRQQQDFNAYMQNRKREQLEILYREKKQRLQRMERQLYQKTIEPTYINLNINPHQLNHLNHKNHIDNKKKPDHQEREKSQKSQEKYIQKKNEPQNSMKQIGKQILKQKLIQIMKKKQQNQRDPQPNLPQNHPNQHYEPQPGIQVSNIAQGIVNLINNTLTQVNANLAKNIERRIDDRKKFQYKQSKSPIRLQSTIPIPKLEPFRSPPIYNFNNVPFQIQGQNKPENREQKIIQKDYNSLKISNDYDDLKVQFQQI